MKIELARLFEDGKVEESTTIECKSVKLPNTDFGKDNLTITIDGPDKSEKTEDGWEIENPHLEQMKKKFFEINREISLLRGGNDTPRRGVEEIEVLFADDPYDGYVGVKILVFDLKKYKILSVKE